MSQRPLQLMRLGCHLLLHVTARLLPRPERTEWLAEWSGELRYAFAREISNRECFNFCLGALPDALWLRRHPLRRAQALESPRRCLALLAVIAFASTSLALLIPQTRHQLFPPAYHGPGNLVVVSPVSAATGSDIEVNASQYLDWIAHPHSALSQTAFYLPTVDQVHIAHGAHVWSIGRATPGLPGLLHIHIPLPLLQACRRSGLVPLVLNHDTWVHDFASDPAMRGRKLHFHGWTAVVVAVAPISDSYLPSRMSAWSIETNKTIHKLAARRFNYGFMLARVAPSSTLSFTTLAGRHGAQARLFLVPLSSFANYDLHQPIIQFLLSLLLTGLVLPTILVVSQRTGLIPERLPIRLRAKSGMFLLAKLALLLPTLFCAPVLLGYCLLNTFGLAYTLTCVAGWLLSFFWVIDDQRRRCPCCLRKLSSPAHVGDPSHTFLSFSGIELLCSEGHGLLHIPDYPTSWFRNQRWLPLDPSWRGLFQPGI